MKTIKGIWRFSRVICYTFVCLFQAYTRFKHVDRKEKGRMLRYYPTQVLKLAGVRCSYEGHVPELLHECGLTDTPPACLVLSNHVSWLDIFSLDSQLPSRFIAKAEIAKWPIFGLIAQQIGTLFINRSSKRAILRINDDIRGALCNCEAVTIFAEGTTTFGNELLPIKANFIAPVCEIGATVQPVILSYKNKGKPTKQAAFSGDVTLFGSLWNVVTMEDAEVVVHFLEPITNTKDLTRHEVAKICEESMRAKLQEIWGDEYIANDANAAEALAKAIANG